MTKKEEYKKNIEEFASAQFNKDQKELAKRMIDVAPDNEVTQWYQLIIQRVKRGFRFDVAPEVNQNMVSILKENESRRINVSDKPTNNENLLIIGENYDALKNLLITHRNKINVIYIDPPYNTESSSKDGNHLGKADIDSNKFIYRDKYSRTGWLNMLNERLKMAKQLLSEDGVIFVSIDDTEQAYLKVLMDEIFGEENFIANLNPLDNMKGKSNDKYISMTSHYIVCYLKSKKALTSFNFVPNDSISFISKYPYRDINDIHYGLMSYKKTGADKEREKRKKLWFPILIKNKKIFSITDNEYSKLLTIKNEFNDIWAKTISKKYKNEGFKVVWPVSGNVKLRWTSNFESFKNLLQKNDLLINSNEGISLKNFPSEKEIRKNMIFGKLKNNFYKKEFSLGTNQLKKLLLNFSNPKSIDLISFLIKLIPNNKNSLILDFFAGSGTTGQAVLELNREDNGNRKFILCTNNENNIATDVTYERMHRIIKGRSFNGEIKNFPWKEKNKIFKNTKLRIFDIKNYKCSLSDSTFNIKTQARKTFKLIDKEYDEKSKLDLYLDLNSLHPQED